jgi:hypothetical protein
MAQEAAKCVPRMLSEGHKEHRVADCYELKEQTENDPQLLHVHD